VIREAEEEKQTKLVMEAYQAEREFVQKQREDEQTAMRIKLKAQKDEAISKRQAAQAANERRQAQEREKQAIVRLERKKYSALVCF
jgi:hypothetical protein